MDSAIQNGDNVVNGHSNGIVQLWDSQDQGYETFQFKDLALDEKLSVIENEALENGIVRPRGHNVSFHYNPKAEQHHFGRKHPMKPWRLQLTKQLVLSYGLEYAMDTYQTSRASTRQLQIYHDREYLDFLKNATPDNIEDEGAVDEASKFNLLGESNDCPIFDGLWDYVTIYSGASLDAAYKLVNQQSDIAINWSGGLHHAKKSMASGFCYINDIVLAIQELLRFHRRVLYIDVDVHHGDGVEEAFWSTDRVMTLSYHRYGPDKNNFSIPFFPGTGGMDDTGPTEPSNAGRKHSLNVPLKDGIDDEQYRYLFEEITGAVIRNYQPEAILLQCGADSLGGDKLGRFNLNIEAHGFCVEFVKRFNLPLLLVGGGGYTPRNVARAWCHETSLCVDVELHNEIPSHVPYRMAFEGEENGDGVLYPNLGTNSSRHKNEHKDADLQILILNIHEQLRYIQGAPSVAMQELPPGSDMARIRAEIDRELEEEMQDRERRAAETRRRKREKNIGGRGELR